jgi:chemotaxis protein histidine kinase CheA
MSANSTLLEVFLTQCMDTLARLESADTTDSQISRAVSDLMGAAELLGNDSTRQRLLLIAADLTRFDPDAVEVLTTIIREVRAELARLAEDSEDGDESPTSEIQKPEPPPPRGDSSPTQVRRKPRRRSNKFDTDEHKTLLSFFRDEALEALDRITDMLLRAPDGGPTPDELNELMRLTHGLKGSAGTVDLPIVAELTHRTEGAFDQVRRGILIWSPAVLDSFVEIADRLRALVIDADDARATDLAAQPVRQLLKNLGKEGVAHPSVPRATTAQSDRRRRDRRVTDSPMLRVEPQRVDRLMDSVGELIFDRTRIERRLAELTSAVEVLRAALPARELAKSASKALLDIAASLEELEGDARALRHTEEALQSGLTHIRMQSVQALFQRLGPQVRRIARSANRRVRLVTTGEDTEFDKSLADQIVDPLIQLLRNAIAHGIESPEERARAGKHEEGKIMITARHEGNAMILEVSDDGMGIDTDRLRARLAETGVWSEKKAGMADDALVQQAIFEAGISSRADADELAGRGVGLSAVRETVTRLGGEVLVSSLPGRGTTFTLRLPLTTALTSAMLFKVGGHVFALPNAHILGPSETHLPRPHRIHTEASGEMPLLSLHEILRFSVDEARKTLPVLCLDYLGKRVALTCDKIIGPREIVVKQLSPILAGMALYAGGTISPSGKVQLILDPAALVASVDASDSQPAREGNATTVLVVDDSRAIREAMRHMLLRAGYEVQTADSGEAAWLRLTSGVFDLVITDLEMPGGDGFELIARMRDSERHADIPTIVISSKTNKANLNRARDLQVKRFLPKPVTQAQLSEVLDECGIRPR